MSRPILVGYDAQTLDRAPVHFGVAAARFTGAPLIVTSVCASSPLPAGYSHEELAPHATEALDRLRSELDGEGIQAEYREVHSTSAPRGLHEAAEREGAGLLVVGSTGRGAVGRVLPGSTAERLMHGAPCAIAVVPHGWEAGGGLNTIGVAYADTDEAREALRGAHALARRAGATLRVLTVVKVHPGMYGETEAATAGQRGKDFGEVEGEHRLRAEAALGSAIAELDAGVDMQVDAFVEDPADTLVRVSENLDLLVWVARLRPAPRRPARRRVASRRGRGTLPRDRAASRCRGTPRGPDGRVTWRFRAVLRTSRLVDRPGQPIDRRSPAADRRRIRLQPSRQPRRVELRTQGSRRASPT